MREHNAFTFLFTILLLGLVLFVGRNDVAEREDNPGYQVQATSLAQVVAAPISRDVRFPGVTQAVPKDGAADADLPTSAFLRTVEIKMPEVAARAVLIVDIESGQELFSLNPYQRWPIASLTKLVTAVVAKREIGTEKPVVISAAAVAAEGPAGGFGMGEKYLAKDLVRALISVSSNDAAEALSEQYGRGGFVAKMNELAKELGMIQTNFADPTGISSLNQSSPEDLRKLIAHIYKNHPDILAHARSKEIEIRELNSGVARKLSSINAFSGRMEFLGGKTGYTDEAGGNLISVFSYLNRPIVIVVLGTDDRFGETEKLFEWVKKSYAP
ncbi:MAG: serine hydrolase [bacterium]|nr:serine hydrolase [bacterium]